MSKACLKGGRQCQKPAVPDVACHVQAKRCRVVMHPSCVGLPGIPEGRWYCPDHADQARQLPPNKAPKGERKPKGDGAKGKAGKKRERSGELHARGEQSHLALALCWLQQR